jgi:oligoendopeptidase F
MEIGMEVLPKVPHIFQRSHVPSIVDFSSWINIKPLFTQLESRSLDKVDDLEAWLCDRSELLDVIGEEGTLRYIRMTCDTNCKELEQAYFHFLEEISENVKAADDRLKRKFLTASSRAQLSPQRYFVLDRSFQNEVDLFREENIRLETAESKCSQSYQKLMGSMTVHFEGKEQTMQQMGRYLESPDRSLRESAWTTMVERRLLERNHFENIFDDLLKIRTQIAANAGCSSYRDYAFKHLERFDYTAQDCFLFHEGVVATVVPLVRKLEERRARELGVDKLRPWDLRVDPQSRPPLKPFTEAVELVEGCVRIADQVDPKFGNFVKIMRDLELLNLESRKGKAPGGYQSSLTEARLPFIFMNAVGLDGDVRTLLHESGHAFHVFATQHEILGHYRHAPIEFCEVASMSMELLGGEHLSEFYPDVEDLKRSRRKHLEGILDLLPWIARVDAFQHWIYSHPEHTIAEREDQWLSLHHRFGGIEDWSRFEQAQRSSWHRQLHIFESPFYYIEYAIAQLGALQIWLNSRTDYKKAVADYWAALQLGGSEPLPKLFERANIRFDFSTAALKPLMEAVEEELTRL